MKQATKRVEIAKINDCLTDIVHARIRSVRPAIELSSIPAIIPPQSVPNLQPSPDFAHSICDNAQSRDIQIQPVMSFHAIMSGDKRQHMLAIPGNHLFRIYSPHNAAHPTPILRKIFRAQKDRPYKDTDLLNPSPDKRTGKACLQELPLELLPSSHLHTQALPSIERGEHPNWQVFEVCRHELMHLKAYAIDGKLLRTGSANFSYSGLHLKQNNDLVIMRDKNVVAKFENQFEGLMK